MTATVTILMSYARCFVAQRGVPQPFAVSHHAELAAFPRAHADLRCEAAQGTILLRRRGLDGEHRRGGDCADCGFGL